MFTKFLKKLLLSCLLFYVSVISESDIGQLPFCSTKETSGLVLVSTIDGRFSALDSEGVLKWQLETGPGPLLASNIHNLELTNNGKWVRIIPSLTGSLYRFDGASIDPIPFTAESLLKSSFKYSEDLVIAGGLEVVTYGVKFHSGKIAYTCSTLRCTNETDNENDSDDILLLERTTQIVRAVETQSGNERWNFSVGYHNIKLPSVTCIKNDASLADWNITAVIPDGLLLSSQSLDNVIKIWQYQFVSPITRVWKFNGTKLDEVDLFALKNERESGITPSIYVGMHRKQLYVHESDAMRERRIENGVVVAGNGVLKIPWKPISASGILTEDDSTAISILYSSDYVDGHGYYLFSATDIKKKNSGLCENNTTLKFPMLSDKSNLLTLSFLKQNWKEILAITLITSFVFNYVNRTLTRRHLEEHQKPKVIYVEHHSQESTSNDRTSESSDSMPFSSRYTNDFDTLACLGKGGFGVVFEVKQKIDECSYAIKRIVLPNEVSKRDAVMREVKALAKLEHRNIVRYFNSWVEKPPLGWQQEHDDQFCRDIQDWTESVTSHANTISSVHNSSYLKSEESETFLPDFPSVNNDDSYIVFKDSENDKSEAATVDDNSNTTDVVTFDELPTSAVNWKRPLRRYHSLNLPKVSPAFLYIQMQLCRKQSLREWMVEHREREFTYVLDMFKQIVSAVEYVHMQGLIHRDLKPSNIFFAMDGSIKVGDFGLVKDVEESYDVPNSYSPLRGHTKEVGTRLYMSPEQVNGKKYNYKVDIYSLGLIFFELLVHFSTDMERIRILSDLRENNYPKDFINKYNQEYQLLKMMLCQKPEKRLTTFGIRARPPISNCDDTFNDNDFELPKSIKSATIYQKS